MSTYHEFEAKFEAQIAALIESVITRKRRLWAEVAESLADRAAFNDFLADYYRCFDPLWQEERAKHAARRHLETRLLIVQRGTDEEAVSVAGRLAEDDAAYHHEDVVGVPPPPRSQTGEPLQGSNTDVGDGESIGYRLVGSATVARLNAKKEIGKMLRQLYHPRRAGDSSERAYLIQSIIDDDDLDEVDLLLYLPFESSDEQLWRLPLHKDENAGERYFRYALWDRLLDEAQNMRVAPLTSILRHELYSAFRRCRDEHIPVRIHFQEEIESLQAKIAAEEQIIARLKAELAGSL